MCARWNIPADDRRDEVVVTMLIRDEVSIRQGGAEVVVSRAQLTDLADKLYFLDLAFRSDARDVVEALCGQE
ncbi:hypothetical protein F1721_18890 [Saccharopolyspora hirsuta]|uniref:Uncharacterized protein n=1 Tax=Saccharopolyspora hirsuta TaxID=1837 RepID=A0A5M7BXE5_SACHI|nr:hypothetical protein [Saccharopolyspora hirsuta]KAA5831891.1 hypothetical protein F1721_18890 [Saccharopolyspora hirsuta]